MKKVLLISLLLIGVISSCSNNEDNIPVDDYLTTNEWQLLAQDSTHIYYASINNESKNGFGSRGVKMLPFFILRQ